MYNVLKERERKKMNIKNITNCVAQVWGCEAHNLSVVEENGRFYAECESLLERRRLSASSYRETINDMFYDYCVENTEWMGVS